MTPDWYEDLAERLVEASDEAAWTAHDGFASMCFGWARQAAKRRAADLRAEVEQAAPAPAGQKG